MRRFAVTVDGAPLPGGEFQPIALRFNPSPSANVLLRHDEVVNAIGRPLRVIEEDWFDLLRAIHAADLVCRRGQNEEWNREIVLSVPLRDPGPFEAVLPLIHDIFGRMTHDKLDIRLAVAPGAVTPTYPKRSAPSDGDIVALLSGGLDSAASAANLYAAGRRPYIISSRQSSHVRSAQKAVIGAVEGQYGRLGVPVAFQVELRYKQPDFPLPQAELSQRSRTLLYTGVAAAVAVAHDIDEVILGENGVMAVNCPLTPGRYAGFSTHTAHPDVLRLMGDLYTRILGRRVRITNPLLYKTKTEVVADLLQAGLRELIPRTHSCWIARQQSHCGTCVPCVVRRFATEAAGTPDDVYQHDCFNAPAPPGDQRAASIDDYLVFALTVSTQSDEDLLLENGVRLHPHLLRHGFATGFLAVGGAVTPAGRHFGPPAARRLLVDRAHAGRSAAMHRKDYLLSIREFLSFCRDLVRNHGSGGVTLATAVAEVNTEPNATPLVWLGGQHDSNSEYTHPAIRYERGTFRRRRGYRGIKANVGCRTAAVGNNRHPPCNSPASHPVSRLGSL